MPYALGVATRNRINQLIQGSLDARLRLLSVGSSSARAAYPTELYGACFNLSAPRPDGRTRQPGCGRHQRASALRTIPYRCSIARPHEPLPTLRLSPHEDRRTARGETRLVTLSFQGTLTPCVSPVRLAHRILMLPHGWTRRSLRRRTETRPSHHRFRRPRRARAPPPRLTQERGGMRRQIPLRVGTGDMNSLRRVRLRPRRCSYTAR